MCACLFARVLMRLCAHVLVHSCACELHLARMFVLVCSCSAHVLVCSHARVLVSWAPVLLCSCALVLKSVCVLKGWCTRESQWIILVWLYSCLTQATSLLRVELVAKYATPNGIRGLRAQRESKLVRNHLLMQMHVCRGPDFKFGVKINLWLMIWKRTTKGCSKSNRALF